MTGAINFKGLIKMRWKLFVEFCLTILIFSIVAGDLFLPQPYRSGSQQLRSNLNEYFISLLPRKTDLNINTKIKRHRQTGI